MGVLDELRAAQVGNDIDIVVVLDALRRGTLPFAIAEKGRPRGILMGRRGFDVRLVRERNRVVERRRHIRLGKQDPGQRRHRFLARLQPEAIGPADVVTEVRPGGSQEYRCAILGRGHRCRHGPRGAAHHQDVDIVQDRDLPGRLRHHARGGGGCPCRCRGLAVGREPGASCRHEQRAGDQEKPRRMGDPQTRSTAFRRPRQCSHDCVLSNNVGSPTRGSVLGALSPLRRQGPVRGRNYRDFSSIFNGKLPHPPESPGRWDRDVRRDGPCTWVAITASAAGEPAPPSSSHPFGPDGRTRHRDNAGGTEKGARDLLS